ncbi:MAG: L,D-transpeptidase family protein [Microbacterium sp.]
MTESDDTPSVDTSSADAPSVDEPSADSSSDDTPSVDTSSADTPSADEPSADSSSADAPDADTPSTAPTAGETVYEWAPPAPTKRKRRGGLWAGGIAVVTIVSVVAASLVLIAPGTAIAGVQVGGLTPGAAADAVQSRLSQTQVVLTGPGGDAIVTGADLGAHVDAKGIADAVFAERPMWNPTAWFSEAADATVTIDEEVATAALRKVVPSLYTDPVDATVTFDAEEKAYTVTPSEQGLGVDVDTVGDALREAFAAGQPTVDLRVASVPVEALTTTAIAQEAADELNDMIATAGFYVGEERTVPISAKKLASWLTVAPDDSGAIAITADATAIQTAVDDLADKVNRDTVATTVIADEDGDTLTTLKKGVSGRTLGDTTGIAAEFAAQLEGGDAEYVLPVEVEKPTVKKVSRSIEVDLSEQRTYLRQNGKIVDSFLVSTGTASHPTYTGTYHIVAKLTSQNMGNPDTDEPPYYYTKNVPWVMYFNGNQALHGAYWHNNFGHVMSHGCVNLPVSVAKRVFDWAPVGTTVWVHG